MPLKTLGDMDQGDTPKFSGGLYAAPEGHLEGNGLIDRYEYLESWESFLKRNFKSTGVWARIIIYLVLQYFANQIEMGQPLLMVAVMYFMAYSLSSAPQSRDKIRSAYSVFNKGNYKSLHGDTTRESLDRQLRFGGM